MRIKFFIIMSLLIFLSTSSFFLPTYLTSRLSNDEYSQAEFNYALKKHYPQALFIAIQQVEKNSNEWHELAIELAKSKGEYAFKLAESYHQQIIDHSDQITIAELSLVIFWYQQAIRLEYKPASLALSQLYFEYDQLALAGKLLNKLTEQNPSKSSNVKNKNQPFNLFEQALILQLKIAMIQGNIDFIQSHIQLLPEKNQLVKDTYRFNVLNDNDINLTVLCENTIQPFATNLHDLYQLDKIIVQFQKTLLNKYVCFNQPRYIPKSELACQFNTSKKIECNEQQWSNKADSISSKYLLVMLPKGGANVHLGIMYVDAEDTLDVFSHEILHLLGFIDEYPLPINHAKCSKFQAHPFSQNIAVLPKYYLFNKNVSRAKLRARILKKIPWGTLIKASTPILQKNVAGWVLGTNETKKYQNEVGVFTAKTCEKTQNNLMSYHSFQPLIQRTKLQYYEESLPESYLKLLEMNTTKYRMPTFHYNIAVAMVKNNQIKKAVSWLEQASKNEKSLFRKRRVIKGDF